MFKKAERKKARLRMGLIGPSGSGKTYSALLMASGLCPDGKIAVIDTENGSADLYANLCEYFTATITPPYTTKKYIDTIKMAEAEGFDVIIIDSLSHAWAGEGGLLDKQGKIADSGRGNSYTAWRKVTPDHNRLIDTMLQSKCHIIATMRAKTDYVIEEDARGKKVPRKVGMAPVQRDGMDYEFTLVFDLDLNHSAQASKDRTSIFDGQIFTPAASTGTQIYEWLQEGRELTEEEIKAQEERKKASQQPELKNLKQAPLNRQQRPTGNQPKPQAQKPTGKDKVLSAKRNELWKLLIAGGICEEQLDREKILAASLEDLDVLINRSKSGDTPFEMMMDDTTGKQEEVPATQDKEKIIA